MTSSIKIDKVSGEGPSPQSKEFGAYLRNLRKGKGLNQADLAKLVTISPAYYGFLEQGRQIPSLKIINNLAEILNTDYLEMAMRAGYDEFVARKKEIYRPKEVSKDDEGYEDDGVGAGEDKTEHQGDKPALEQDGSDNASAADTGTTIRTTASDEIGTQETREAQTSNSDLLPSPDDLGLSMERLDWAMGCISRDPTYKLADQFRGDISREVKTLVIQLYQAQTGRQLLTGDESLALSYTIHG